MKEKHIKIKLTKVSTLHYVRLVMRSLMFVVLLVFYIIYRFRGGRTIESYMESYPGVLIFVWAVFVFEMVMRFFPSRLESPG